jgi:hypothetical protein
MKLPNLENLLIPEHKITDYLLSDENSKGKSAFFTSCGFTQTNWKELRHALQQHAINHDVQLVSKTIYGTKYIIEAFMQIPDGRCLKIRSVWIIDTGTEIPRLVTAYPLHGEKIYDTRT